MTTPSLSDLPLTPGSFLAGLASALLLFVTAGVIYLSSVEWRDKRRRARDAQRRS